MYEDLIDEPVVATDNTYDDLVGESVATPTPTPSPAPASAPVSAPINTADFYTTMKAERMGLVNPSGMDSYVAQASRQSAAQKLKREEADIVAKIQADLDRGVAVDPALIADYAHKLRLPELPKAAAQQEPVRTQEESTLEMRRKQFAKNAAKADAELLAKQAELAPSVGELMLGEDSTSGDILRSVGSMASGVGNLLPSTIKGVLDLPGIKQTLGNTAAGKLVSDWAGKLEGNKAELVSEISQRGGVGAEVSQNLANMMAETAANLAVLGVSKVFSGGTKLIPNVKAAGKLAMLAYAQTPGNQSDKLKAAALMGAFALTPIPASKMPKDWMAKAVNIVENIGLGAVAGNYSGEVPWTQKIPQIILDSVFGLAAKGKGVKLPEPTTRSAEFSKPPKDVGVIPETLPIEQPTRVEVPVTASKPSEAPVEAVKAPEVAPKPATMPVEASKVVAPIPDTLPVVDAAKVEPVVVPAKEPASAEAKGTVGMTGAKDYPNKGEYIRFKEDGSEYFIERVTANRMFLVDTKGQRQDVPRATPVIRREAVPPSKPVSPEAKGAQAKPLTDFEVRYTNKEGNRGKTWVQAEDAQLAVSKAQKMFNAEGTGEKVTSAIKSKMPMTEPTAPVKGPGLNAAVETTEPLATKGDADIIAVASKTPKSEQTKKGGFISVLPGGERLADIGKTIVDWTKLRFTTGKGQSDAQNAIAETDRLHRNMFNIHQKIVGNKVATAVKELTKTMDETAVNKSVMEVLSGTKSIDQFKADFNLPDTHAVVQELKWVLNDRAQMSEKIAAQLDLQGKKDIAKTIRENKGDYLTRFYMKHIMGSSFVPEPADFQAAVDAVKVDLVKQVSKLGKRASRLGRVMVKAGGTDPLADTQRFIETGDRALVSHLTERQQDFARLLRDRYMGIQDLVANVAVDPAAVRKGKLVELEQKADALESAAKNTVDYMLGNEPTVGDKGGAPIDISHLTKRVLTPVFRKLFQEVDTPIEVAQKTAEVQGHMLVGLETLNNIYEQGAGKWWTRSAPNKELGLTVRLEGKRFGKLDGAFVSKATSELLGSQATKASEAMRMYENLVHYQRTIQVATSFPTTERNLLSGYASFAVASGDAMRPGFHKNMATAAGFVAKLAKARKGTSEYTTLLTELEQLAKIGAFHVSETSTSADIMTKEGNFGKSPNALDRFFSPLGKLQNKAGKMYAYGDFITKYASYLTQKGMGKTDAQAAEHVQKFYQHPSSLPTALRWFSKLPLADYPTYTFDSIRIKKNQIVHAAESATKGDLIPLLGFALSNGIYALAAGGTSWVKDALSDKMKEKIAALPDDQLRAMKAFQPDYWQNTPVFARNGRDDKGNPVIDYVVTGNIFAFPLDDVTMGAIQNKSFGSFLNGSYQLLGKTGMTVNSLSKLFAGQEVGAGASYYKTKGLLDVMRSDSDHKVAETFGMIAKTAVELALPVPRRVQKSFSRWLKIDEKLAAKTISPEDANEQKADILMSEVLPMKVRTITRDVAHDMMFNTLKPSNDTIKELDGRVGRGVDKNATATQIQDGKDAETDLRNKYSEVIDKVRLSAIAFKGVSSVDDIKRTVVDIFGVTKGGLILQGHLEDLIKISKVPSSVRHKYEKGREESY
jgi:hypothetical protein